MKAPLAAAVLRENVQGLQQAIASLQWATDGCARVGDGPSFTYAELDAIEVLARSLLPHDGFPREQSPAGDRPVRARAGGIVD